MDLIFIIGLARTASKSYQRLINENSDINVVDEMHFCVPSWIKKDFRHFAQKVRKRTTNENLYRGIENLMYSCTLNGAYWKKPRNINQKTHRIFDLNRTKISNRLRASDCSDRDIMKIILEEHAQANGKNIGGAKFPVNIADAGKIMQWFPDAWYLHIIRDPRASFPSMVKMDLKKIDRASYVNRLSAKIKRLIYLKHQYYWATKTHLQCQGNRKYFLSKFEDFVINPRKQIMNICQWLNIDYREKMLDTRVIDTSFAVDKNKRGFDIKAVDRWKEILSPFEISCVQTLLKNEMKMFEYNSR